MLLLTAALALNVANVHAQPRLQQWFERAKESVVAEEYAFARELLGPILIAPQISNVDRAKAYLLRGRSFLAEGLNRSALLDFRYALQFDPANGEATSVLAYLHHEGLGIPRDPDEAARLYLKAARQGVVEAQRNAGVLHLLGGGVPLNVQKARYWLEQAIGQGDSVAMLHLGRSYWRADDLTQRDYALAASWLNKAAAAGVAETWLELGQMHQAAPPADLPPGQPGDRTLPDYIAARQYYQRAVDQHLASGLTALAHMNEHGLGQGADLSAAVKLYRQAADAGDAYAQAKLGYLYETGHGVAKSSSAAQQWYERAASQGDTSARILLAALLGAGDGVPRDVPRAITLLEAALEEDDPRVTNTLAWILATTLDNSLRNGDRAVRLARSAVAQDRQPDYYDTLAAAYAESGDFDQAVAAQQQAIELAAAKQQDRQDFNQRMHKYRSREPWRE